MRRIVIWLASTITVVVLLFAFHTSTNTPAAASSAPAASTPAQPDDGSSASTPSQPGNSPSASATSSTPLASTSPPAATKTYVGQVAETRWGPVQVKITVTGGTITRAAVLQAPSGNPRDVEINDQALPILIQETIDAQSAKIDMVSGATVTSDGYLQSLQSALDAAGI